MINGNGFDGLLDWWLKLTIVCLCLAPFGAWKVIELIMGWIK